MPDRLNEAKASWWGTTTPPTTVTNTAITWIGANFLVTEQTYFWGGRIYLFGGFSYIPVFALWEWNTNELMWIGTNKYGEITPASNGWVQKWAAPRKTLLAGHTYAIACQVNHNWTRQNTALAGGDVTHGRISLHQSFQSTSPAPWLVALTANTNANGIDILEGQF